MEVQVIKQKYQSSHCKYIAVIQLPLNTPYHWGHFTREGFAFWPFHTTDINQSCSQEIPDVNLFHFLFLLVDYHKTFSSAVNVVHEKLSFPVLTVKFVCSLNLLKKAFQLNLQCQISKT